jgi:hypothetical protein
MGKVAAAAAGGAMKAKRVMTIKKTQPEGKKVRQHSERGNGLKFSLEAYETVSKFTPQTKIKYGPNPKTKGSKSFDRYAKYMKAKTIEEAVKLGSKPADFLWEYERGLYKVVGGPMSDMPGCLRGKKPSEMTACEKVLASFKGPPGHSLKMSPERRALCEKLAKEFGMDLDKLHQEADTTGNNESADVQTQRTLANCLAERIMRNVEKAGRKVSDGDVLEALQAWGFSENVNRLNVMPEGTTFVHSDTLGAIRLRTGGFRITDPTLSYPHFTGLICQWFADHQPADIKCDCVFTGINVNSNYAGRVHRDANNEGPSAIKALGKFTGGKLRYWPQDKTRPKPDVTTLDVKDSIIMDLSKKFAIFNGNCAHGVEAFKGERFSLVFFTTKGYQKIKGEDFKKMEKVGFKVPTEKLIKDMKAHVITAHG